MKGNQRVRCLSCMKVNPWENKFCEQCGSQLQHACSRCGQEVNPSARFCGHCGHGLAASASETEAPRWGELKQATVLFADVVGSTELVSTMDPEQAMGRLRPAVLSMRQSIERFGGTVVRTLGDGVLALFGVPLALEGHALLACQAALHMQKTFAAGGDGLSIRIGLHSGEVASDPQDAEDGRGGGVHGLTIHIASRVVTLAEPGGVCITEACRATAGPGCEASPLGEHSLKGIRDPVELHVLRSVRATALARDVGTIPAGSFHGRDQELARLDAAMASIERGNARVVGISGEPGAGKSRLCEEFASYCRELDIPVYEVRAQLYGHALPLQPILELFRVHFFGIAAGDDAATARQLIASRFAPLQPTVDDLAVLHEFFGVALEHGPPPLGPRTRQGRLLALLRNLLRAEAQVRRVILIEDLHWLDEGSEEFVSLLVEAVTGTRTFLLLNYRASYRCPWKQVAHFEQIDLAELPAVEMESLVAELLLTVSSAPEIRELVCHRAGGNPFFAEELVRMLADTKLLSADSSLPAGGVEAVERALPATVQAVVGARLDRLGEPEKTLLQMCAIIGKEIPLAVLENVASPLARQIERGLDGLCRAGLILPQPTDAGRRFAFRHPLIQEVAYGAQLKVRRGQVHASVAVAMELYYAEQLDEYSALVGYHFEQAGQPLEAARYNARAADWVGHLNSAQAIKHWRKVRELLQPIVRTAETDRLRVTAGAKIALLGWRQGMSLQEVKPLIDEALALAKVEDRLVPWLLMIEGRMLVASGGPADGYVDCVRKALLYIDVDRDHGRVALAHVFLSQAYSWAGLLSEALAANDVAKEKSMHVDAFDRDFIGFDIELWILYLRARLLARMGRIEEARPCLDRIEVLEASTADVPVPGMTRLGFVELALALEDAELAGEHAGHLVALAKKHDTPYLSTFVDGYRGMAALLADEHGEALARLLAALATVRKTGAATEFETELLASLAECHLCMGEFEEAHSYATEAISLAQPRSNRIAECRARIARGAAALSLGAERRLDAHSDFELAQALVDATGAVACATALARARQAFSVARAA